MSFSDILCTIIGCLLRNGICVHQLTAFILKTVFGCVLAAVAFLTLCQNLSPIRLPGHVIFHVKFTQSFSGCISCYDIDQAAKKRKMSVQVCLCSSTESFFRLSSPFSHGCHQSRLTQQAYYEQKRSIHGHNINASQVFDAFAEDLRNQTCREVARLLFTKVHMLKYSLKL